MGLCYLRNPHGDVQKRRSKPFQRIEHRHRQPRVKHLVAVLGIDVEVCPIGDALLLAIDGQLPQKGRRQAHRFFAVERRPGPAPFGVEAFDEPARRFRVPVTAVALRQQPAHDEEIVGR